MDFCFSGSPLRANFSIVSMFFLVLYSYCSWQINFSFFVLSGSDQY